MPDINNLFFELIRIAIGNQVCLSHTPNAGEWQELYTIAKKQALVGICFAGVQKLQAQRQAPNSWDNEQGELLYLQWMGMAAKIQQRNEVLREKGDELIERLNADGMEACILKGQSLSSYYASTGSAQVQSLGHLRQSGDIDVWVRNKTIMELDAYVKGLGCKPKTTAAHVSYEDKEGVEIELHPVPAFMRNFRTNKRLKAWFQEVSSSNGSTTEFNLVYMMVHMYHHVLFEGLGLRQVMDYYFVLRNTNFQELSTNFSLIFSRLAMLNFAKGIIWIMKVVFAMEDKYHLCVASEKYGRLILEDVMLGGNFGHHDDKNKGLHGGTAIGRSLCGLKRNMKFFALGPLEILSSPVWSLWHWWWRCRRGYK